MSTRSARPPRCYGPSGDTPPAPRLGWQLWALRPGLDGASRPPTTLTGCGGTPDSGRAGPEPPSRAATTTRCCRSTYAVSSGVSFRCRQGVSFECRLTGVDHPFDRRSADVCLDAQSEVYRSAVVPVLQRHAGSNLSHRSPILTHPDLQVHSDHDLLDPVHETFSPHRRSSMVPHSVPQQVCSAPRSTPAENVPLMPAVARESGPLQARRGAARPDRRSRRVVNRCEYGSAFSVS